MLADDYSMLAGDAVEMVQTGLVHHGYAVVQHARVAFLFLRMEDMVVPLAVVPLDVEDAAH